LIFIILDIHYKEKMLQHVPAEISIKQLKTLLKGGSITLKPEHFNNSSSQAFLLTPQTTRRIQTAITKGKGLRIMLKPQEDFVDSKSGGSLLDDIRNAFRPGGSGEQFGRQVAGTLIHQP